MNAYTLLMEQGGFFGIALRFRLSGTSSRDKVLRIFFLSSTSSQPNQHSDLKAVGFCFESRRILF